MQPRSVPVGIQAVTSATAKAKGLGVRRSGSAVDTVALLSAVTDPMLGVVYTPIPAGGWGDVQTHGIAICKSGGAISAGAEIECGIDGKFVTRSTGRAVGIANTAATGADEDFEAYLHGPGGSLNPGQGVIGERTLTVGHADLTDADGSQDINIGAALPDRAMILGVSFSALTVFAGGGVTLTLDIGDATDPDAIKDGVQLATAVDGQPATATDGIAPNKTYTAATQLVARFLGAGGNVADLTSGTVTIRVQYVQLPA